MLQNPAAKLTDVDPSVAQHYHHKLLEARREKAHVSRLPPPSPLCVVYRLLRSTLCKNIMQSVESYSYSQRLQLARSDWRCLKEVSGRCRRCLRVTQASENHMTTPPPHSLPAVCACTSSSDVCGLIIWVTGADASAFGCESRS